MVGTNPSIQRATSLPAARTRNSPRASTQVPFQFPEGVRSLELEVDEGTVLPGTQKGGQKEEGDQTGSGECSKPSSDFLQ
jgi:hypothetical protein